MAARGAQRWSNVVTRRAVVLAGGRGRRLAPYTTVLPKPLMPVGDRSILDIVLRRLGAAGFDDVTLAVGHLAHLICAVLGDGSGLGVSVRYHHEEEPLGTAGPLAAIPDLDGTFLMLNGDVLTTLDLRALVRAHEEAGNLLTIATHRRVVRADYGVLHTDGAVGATRRVVTYEEKPELPYTVSMGIYVVEPEAVEHVPAGRYYDLPDLVQALLAAGSPVGSFPFDGPWLDIGREDDYRRAQAEAEVWQP
jgi:NDP-mannose synthase